MSTKDDLEDGVRILSFDHGGPGTYSQLLIIKEYMSRLAVDSEVDVDDLYPADYFDMMGGVGFGGLVALMLGRLRMSIDRAIDSFLSVALAVFLTDKEHSPEANLRRLKEAIELTLQGENVSVDAKMYDQNHSPAKCKVALYAVDAAATSDIAIFRTYLSDDSGLNPTIVQAACATMALPSLFSSVNIRSPRDQWFVGGEPDTQNPTRELLKEAGAVFGRDRRVAQILSLGSGRPQVIPLEQTDTAEGVDSAMNRLASACEAIAQDLSNRWFNYDEYLRINAHVEIDTFGLGDWNALGRIESHTRAFMERGSVSDSLEASLQRLRTKVGRVTLGSLNHMASIKLTAKTPPPVCPHFVLREKEWQAMIDFLIMPMDTGARVFFITGVAGCGKTQLVSYFLQENWSLYTHVVYLDASSVATVRAGIEAWYKLFEDGHEEDLWKVAFSFLFTKGHLTRRLVLIFDGADDPALDLGALCRENQSVTILVTSQIQHTGFDASQYYLPMGPMTAEEASSVILLSSQRSISILPEELQSVHKITIELDYFAISLAQAGSYSRYQAYVAPTAYRPHIFTNYLDLFDTQRDIAMKQPMIHLREDFWRGIPTVLNFSYAAIPPSAREFLHLVSQFHHVDIPFAVLLTAAENGFEDQESYLPRLEEHSITIANLKKRVFLDQSHSKMGVALETIRILCSHSLISTTVIAGSMLIQLHPVVQAWLKEMPLETPPDYRAMARQILTSGSKESNPALDYQIFTHVESLLLNNDGTALHVNDRMAAGKIMSKLGHHSRAEKLFEESLGILLRVLGREDMHALLVAGYLAETYMKQHRWHMAEKLLLETHGKMCSVLGDNNLDTLNAAENLAATYMEQGRWEHAKPLQRNVRLHRRTILGKRHPDTLKAVEQLGRSRAMESVFLETEPMLDTLQEKRRAGRRKIISTREKVASTSQQQGLLKEIEDLHLETLEKWKDTIGIDHPHTIGATESLADIYDDQERWDEAEQLRHGVLEQRRRILGNEHPDTINATEKLASTYRMHGNLVEGEKFQEEVLNLRILTVGKPDPDTMESMRKLSTIYQLQGQLDKATLLEQKFYDFVEVKALLEETGEIEHSKTILAIVNRGVFYDHHGRFDDAESADIGVLEQRHATLGKYHLDTVSAAERLALTYHAQGRLDEAEKLQLWVRNRRSQLPVSHPYVIRSTAILAVIIAEQFRWSEAESLQVEVLELQRRLLAQPRVLEAATALAATYCEQENWVKAEVLQSEILEQRRTHLGRAHSDTIRATADLASTYHMQGKWYEAGKLREEILEQRQSALGERHPHTILAAESLDATRRAPKEVEAARRVISGLTSENGERAMSSFRNVVDVDSDPVFPHPSNPVSTPILDSKTAPSIPTWLMEEHQRIIERVHLWYHDAGPLAKAMNEVPALSVTGYSYRVQLVALNLELSQTSMMVDRNSTYSHIGFQLKTHNVAALPVALEQINGPIPRWRIPDIDSRVPRGLQKIYVVDLSEPFTMALVRDVEEDFPLLLSLSSFNDTTTTLGDLIGAKLDGRAKSRASIKFLSSPHDIQGLSCEIVQKEIKGVYSTTIFVLLTDDPLAYKFRNVYNGRIPPPLQVAFPQCRNLVESAPRLKEFAFQGIDFSRALLHLAICLAEATIEERIEGTLQVYLISRLKSMVTKLKGIFTDIENSTDSHSPAIAKSLHLFFYQLCEEQPGVVAVRQSLESLQALIALDPQNQGSSSEITGMSLLVQEEDSVEQDGTVLPVVTSRDPSGLDGSVSSDSLSSSDHESSSILAGDGLT